ncbi:MAG TPA: SDR family oxidoreductase [Nocardioidaceae bacterium]|nr:SDR family oxidoreductase [Nocardioidaceae bacterium]
MERNASAVVTGGARGIGRSIAELMVRRGYRVVVTDVDEESVRRTADQIGAVAGLAHDVRDEAAHQVVADTALEHGPCAVWFNNAGVGHDGTVSELSSGSVSQLVEVNLLGTIWGTRAALGAFGDSGGDIVNIASLSGHGPVPGLSVYAATKAAVVSLSMSVNAETPRRVRVHALCPDGVATQMVDAMVPSGRAKALVHSGGRMLSAEQVGAAAVAMIGTRRVVRTVPGWRGGMARFTALTPSVSMRAEPLLRWQGRRAIRRSSSSRPG